MKNVTVNTIQKYKNAKKPITAITAYDYSTAKSLDETGIDIILVGDSLAMVVLGYETTHQVTMEEMLVFTGAVSRGAKNSLIVADMPFMSFHADEAEAVRNAGRFIKEAGAKAVKVEGGSPYIVKVVKHCVDVGIPVVAHLGFTPQFLNTIGGYNIQGKSAETTEAILQQALELQVAGAFALVLEMVPEESAKLITENLTIPTLGIGAGRYCSGQIIVSDDVLGKYSDFTPKFARKFADMKTLMTNAFSDYKNCVENGTFPNENEVFNLKDEEREKLKHIAAKIVK